MGQHDRHGRYYTPQQITQRHNSILEREEEGELIRKYYTEEDTAAGDALVLAHQRLVMKIAASYARRTRGMPLDDLFSEGNVGLLEARKRYNKDRGVRFMTYAGWWVRASIVHHVMMQGKLVNTNTTSRKRKMHANFNTMRRRIEHEVAKKYGESPAYHRDEVESRLAEHFNVDVGFVQEFDSAGSAAPLDTIGTAYDAQDRQSSGFILSVDEWDKFFERKQSDTLCAILKRGHESLSSVERDIIERRFNIGYDARYHGRETLTEIANRYDLSRERIRQLEERALKKLRAIIEADLKRFPHECQGNVA